MPSDPLIQELTVTPPVGGLQDGLDPALEGFGPQFAADLDNIRVGRGLIETRAGAALWRTLGGAGNVRLLTTGYDSSARRFRLAIRGGTAYDWDEDVTPDVAFVAVSGGTGFADAPIHACQHGNYLYLADGTGSLRRYTLAAASVIAVVAQPTLPSAAPGWRPRAYGYLEKWSGAAPFGWNETSAADWDVIDASVTDPWPGGNTVKLRAKTTSAQKKRVQDNVTGETLNSAHIAFWFNKGKGEIRVGFEIGIATSGEFSFKIDPPKKDIWYPFFAPVGNLESISYKQFQCLKSTDTFNILVGPLILPGRLDGKYRYRYTHYNSATGAESELSAASVVMDMSIRGQSYRTSTEDAFRRCAVIVMAGDGVAGTDKFRVYRSGGVPSLTKDSQGNDVWIRIAEVTDLQTTVFNTSSGLTMQVSTTTGFTVGDWIVINRGGATEEIRQIASFTTPGALGYINFASDSGLDNTHNAFETVQICYLDNNANEAIDTSLRAQVERDDPPAGAVWIDRTPDGRLWIFRYTGRPAGICVSNKPTPDRLMDHEVFPDGVDPFTRQDLLQGWRFDVGGSGAGEEIMWGGVFNRVPTVITRTGVYQVYASSQAEWSPTACVKVLDEVGCLNGETVAKVNGALYWITDGPRLVRWDGSGAPEIISAVRINKTLKDAPPAYWGSWFAVSHAKRDGAYYQLFMVPSGSTVPTKILGYNVDLDVWEPCSYRDGGGTLLQWHRAHVPRGGSDTRLLWAATSSGAILELDQEASLTDNGAAIRILFKSKRYYFGGYLARHERLQYRFQGVTAATLAVQVKVGGSEYGENSQSYALSGAGAVDMNPAQRTHYKTLQGCWVEYQVSGDVSYRFALRDLWGYWRPVRVWRYSGTT